MNSGILLINKPTTMTSHQVVATIKRRFNLKKVGHAGTLDPLATGVLIILINQATKISSLLLNEDKGYIVTMQFNIETDSGDITGKIISEDNKKIMIDEFKNCLTNFPRAYYQVPPKFSAIKVNGKKMYQYARNEVEVPLIKRFVTLSTLEIIDFTFPEATLLVKCSKGTYIRSLVVDIATKLRTVATVKALQRISSGKYLLRNCYALDDCQEANIISLKDVLKEYMTIVIAVNVQDVKNGKQLYFKNLTTPQVLVVDQNQCPLAIYVAVKDEQYVCKKGLWNNYESD